MIFNKFAFYIFLQGALNVYLVLNRSQTLFTTFFFLNNVKKEKKNPSLQSARNAASPYALTRIITVGYEA